MCVNVCVNSAIESGRARHMAPHSEPLSTHATGTRWRPGQLESAQPVWRLTCARSSPPFRDSGIVLLVTLFIFFSVEQSLIAGNLAVSRAALAQNNAIRATNDKLEEAKQELQDEEDEYVQCPRLPWIVARVNCKRLDTHAPAAAGVGRPRMYRCSSLGMLASPAPHRDRTP